MKNKNDQLEFLWENPEREMREIVDFLEINEKLIKNEI
tara:strand:+ start:1136 stop:1249 length:114 start_codon:yes stop_codon:yes gene_type:complete